MTARGPVQALSGTDSATGSGTKAATEHATEPYTMLGITPGTTPATIPADTPAATPATARATPPAAIPARLGIRLGLATAALALLLPVLRPAAALAQPAASGPARAAPPTAAGDGRRSGLLDMSPALQALQRDDTQNPAMLMVQDGAALWMQRAGAAGRACQDCHGPAESRMAGVAARYPAIDAASGQAIDLAGRIRQCRSQRQQALPWAAESTEVLALSAWLGLVSRGQPIRPPDDERLRDWQARGERLWHQRMGQLNLACAQCHDRLAGQRLGGALIPQGHATGYPIYRLEWQGLGSLQRRLRACLVGVRAEPFAADAPEWLALEAYLARRAAGMVVETPAVRP